MRGFSYVEMLVGMAISTLLVLGFVRYSHQVTNQFLSSRKFQQAHGQLFSAQTALRQVLQQGEPSFWQQFPLNLAPIHQVEHTANQIQAAESCPYSEHGGCLTFWDLKPFTKPPRVYKLVDHDFPHWIHPTPLEDDIEQGPGEELQTGVVILFHGDEGTFPLLLADVAGDEVALAPLEHQPWKLPENLGEVTSMNVTPIARVELLHVSLTSMENRNYALRYQPWSYASDQWLVHQSRTAETYLTDLAILGEEEDLPLRLLLVSQPAQPQPLPLPKRIGRHTYDSEVYFATLAL